MNLKQFINTWRNTHTPVAGARHDDLDPDKLPWGSAPGNPYLASRRHWNDHLRAVLMARDSWQLVGLLSLLIALASVGGMTYIGAQSKFVPYVVEVDKLGALKAVAPAIGTTVVDQRIMHAAVASFITDLRIVSPDVALQRRSIFRAYSMLSGKDPATVKANEFLNGTEERNPFKRAEKEIVSIEISSVIPQTPDTWQIDWLEMVRDRQGVVMGPPIRMRALVTTYIAPTSTQTTEEQIRNNPLSIYVRDFSWSKQV